MTRKRHDLAACLDMIGAQDDHETPQRFMSWGPQLPEPDDWLKGEPRLHEILDDPIVRLVMRRDNLGPADVWAAVDRARASLRGRGRRETEISRDVA
jgi:hypothetical protein